MRWLQQLFRSKVEKMVLENGILLKMFGQNFITTKGRLVLTKPFSGIKRVAGLMFGALTKAEFI